MTNATAWFDVDKEGLHQLLGPRGRATVLLELISNALDENVTVIDMHLDHLGHGMWQFQITDDAPDGFRDLSHAYTLFAASRKKDDPEKRGRFNLGEKLAIAVCDEVEIISTTGGVVFNKGGRMRTRKTRAAGTWFSANLRLTTDEVQEFRDLVPKIILNKGDGLDDIPRVLLDGGELDLGRSPCVSFTASLETVKSNEHGVMGKITRATYVHVFCPRPGETPMLYELGIPVVEHEGACGYHIDVRQKVPLNMDRDNVRPAWRRELLAEVVNALTAQEQLTKDEATKPWVTTAIESDRIRPEAVTEVLDQRYGEKRVAFDPSDHEANRIAFSKGYTVVPGGAFSRDAWSQIKGMNALPAAGRVTPSPSLEFSAEGSPPIGEDSYDAGQLAYVRHAKNVCKRLLNMDVSILIYERLPMTDGGHAAMAWSRGGRLSINWRVVKNLTTQQTNALLLHECAHEKYSGHLDSRFPDEIARLGANLAAYARRGEVDV